MFVQNHILQCSQVLVCVSGPESRSAKFYRLQHRLRLQPKRPTLIDSNSGLDSDSAALLTRRLGTGAVGGGTLAAVVGPSVTYSYLARQA